MSNQSTDTNSIILLVNSDDPSSVEGQRGWGDDARKRISGLVEVNLDPSVLERQMGAFLTMVGRLFHQAEQQMQPKQGVHLSEIELSVEIGAKGEVKLVAGGEASGKGAIKLKFVRATETV